MAREAPAVPRTAARAATSPDYDLVIALRLAFANQGIAQLRADGAVPAELGLEPTQGLFSSDLLARFQIASSHPHTPSPLPLPHPISPALPGGPIAGTARKLLFPAPPFLDTASAAGKIEAVVPFRLDVDLKGSPPASRAILGR